MSKSPLYLKLKAIADDFVCGDWGSPRVLSPQLHTAKVNHEFDMQPETLTRVRQLRAAGKWALVFTGRRVQDSRTRTGSNPLEAIVSFTPEQVRTMSPHEIRRTMIGVIAMREFHEVLEWAQLRSDLGEPIVNPHHPSEDLDIIVQRVMEAMIDVAAV